MAYRPPWGSAKRGGGRALSVGPLGAGAPRRNCGRLVETGIAYRTHLGSGGRVKTKSFLKKWRSAPSLKGIFSNVVFRETAAALFFLAVHFTTVVSSGCRRWSDDVFKHFKES